MWSPKTKLEGGSEEGVAQLLDYIIHGYDAAVMFLSDYDIVFLEQDNRLEGTVPENQKVVFDREFLEDPLLTLPQPTDLMI